MGEESKRGPERQPRNRREKEKSGGKKHEMGGERAGEKKDEQGLQTQGYLRA